MERAGEALGNVRKTCYETFVVQKKDQEEMSRVGSLRLTDE